VIDWNRLELDNLRVALTWSAAQPAGDGRRLVRLAGLLGRVWRDREHKQEGLDWLEAGMRTARATESRSADTVRVLSWLGILYAHGAQPASEARAVDDVRLCSLAMRHLGLVCFGDSEYQRAGELFAEALEASRAASSKREIAWNLGVPASNQVQQAGDHAGAKRLPDESIALGRECGDPLPVLYSMIIMGHIVASEGDNVGAREIAERALVIACRTDARDFIRGLMLMLGDIATREGDWVTAENQYRQALQVSVGAASKLRLANAILKFAWLRSAQGEYHNAVRLLGALSRIDH
jgi:tetratricopeptide (TPR) repeat protein